MLKAFYLTIGADHKTRAGGKKEQAGHFRGVLVLHMGALCSDCY